MCKLTMQNNNTAMKVARLKVRAHDEDPLENENKGSLITVIQ